MYKESHSDRPNHSLLPPAGVDRSSFFQLVGCILFTVKFSFLALLFLLFFFYNQYSLTDNSNKREKQKVAAAVRFLVDCRHVLNFSFTTVFTLSYF